MPFFLNLFGEHEVVYQLTFSCNKILFNYKKTDYAFCSFLNKKAIV